MGEPLPRNWYGLLMVFTEDLQQALGPDLVSVTLYGSAARDDFVEGVSDINLLVVVSRLPAFVLKAAGEAVNRWRSRIPISPIFATEDYIARSADVFPLEFLDMRDAHSTILGPDPLARLDVDTVCLRRQVEAELKGKLMWLRAAYARSAHDPGAVAELMVDSLPSFRAIFQGALRLTGQAPPTRTAEVIERIALVIGMEADGLLAVMRLRDDASDREGPDMDRVFNGYLAAVERAARWADEWEEPSP